MGPTFIPEEKTIQERDLDLQRVRGEEIDDLLDDELVQKTMPLVDRAGEEGLQLGIPEGLLGPFRRGRGVPNEADGLGEGQLRALREPLQAGHQLGLEARTQVVLRALFVHPEHRPDVTHELAPRRLVERRTQIHLVLARVRRADRPSPHLRQHHAQYQNPAVHASH